MPERSFGRTVRYRRTKLGLSQAKLGELVGRSTATIRSWERDKSRPNDEKVLSTLAAILGIEERQLFEKAEIDPPRVVETSPTVEQALASLRIADHPPAESASEPSVDVGNDEKAEDSEPSMPAFVRPSPDAEEDAEQDESVENEGDAPDLPVAGTPRPVSVAPTPPPAAAPLFASSSAAVAVDDDDHSDFDSPGYLPPPEPYVQTPLTPTLADISYIEDASQRQLYRVRNLATLVAVVALVVAFVWAVGEGLGALGDWWNEFFGNLRL